MRVLSFGGGVDSSAILLIHLYRQDLDIDHVVFSDTGAESAGTYANVRYFKNLCEQRGIPFSIVSKEGETITQWVTRLGIVPVMIGGSHVCSSKFKGEVIAKWAKKNFPGEPITYLIGIETDELYRKKRFTKPAQDKANYEYPLIDLGETRDSCLALIESFGLDVPKSSCVFCPFMSEGEIRQARKDPQTWDLIKLVENRFQEESPIKHQRWIDNGKPLTLLRPKGWKEGNATVTPGKKDIGDHCKIGWRAPDEMWQQDSWANGARLFTKQMETPEGKRRLSVAEWEQLIDSEEQSSQFEQPMLGDLLAIDQSRPEWSSEEKELLNRVINRLEKQQLEERV